MLVRLSSRTHTHKDACCTVCMSELRVPLRPADQSEWLCSLLCPVPMKTAVFSQLFIVGADLRDEASCMYMSACCASCDAQGLDILTLNSSCWPLWCIMFSSGATCVSLVYGMNCLSTWAALAYTCVWTLCSVVGSFQTVCIHCSILTLVKTLLSVMFG